MAITPLPSAPQISDDPATFNTKANAFVGALPTMVTEINAELPAIDAAGDASDAALAAANFKGEWSTLTGALNIPASVSHNGQVWVLKNNLADVTLSEPGTGSPGDWIGVSLPAPGAEGNYLKSDGTNWVSEAFPVAADKTWTAFTASGTYTVPDGITSIRAYAFGGGGDGINGTYHNGGGGGGCAFGDIAVTPGSTVTIDITSKIAKLTYNSVDLLVANPGATATDSGSGGGVGGTATKDASVTNGGAYSGGNGGDSTDSAREAGGGSSGSPLGNGWTGGGGNPNGVNYAGGAGWGGSGGSSSLNVMTGGGGVGGAGSGDSYGGGGGSLSAAVGRSGGKARDISNLFTDPLLIGCTGTGGNGSETSTEVGEHGGPGGGGGAGLIVGGNGGFGGGGGAGTTGGDGGFGGGGGGGNTGGNGGFGGGGGGANTTAGTGGGAIVLIYA